MIDIFFVSRDCRGNNYGVGSFQKLLTRQLGGNKGFKLHNVFLNSDKYKEYTQVEEEGIDAIHIPSPLYSKASHQNNEYNKVAAQLMRLETSKCSKAILHFNQIQDISGFKQELPECKIVYTAHTVFWKFNLNGNIKRFEKIWKDHNSGNSEDTEYVVGNKKEKKSYAIDKQAAIETRNDEIALQSAIDQQNIIQHSDISICVTQHAISYFVQNFNIDKRKLKLIYNGVELTDSRPPSAQAKLEAKLDMGFTEDEKIMLYVGRLDAGKGIECLIEAFANIVEQVPDAKLVIVGDGNIEYYLKLATWFPAKVTFTGRVTKEEISNYYLAADIGVIPSMYEQCSYVAMEMMQHALPVVVTAVDGLDEMFTDNVDALKVNVDLSQGVPKPDIDQLSLHLQRLLTDESLRKSLGEKSFENCINKFQVKDMVDKTIETYQAIEL